MKKKLATVTLLLSTAIAAAGCDDTNVTYKENDGKSVIFTIKTDSGTEYYYADDLLKDLQEGSSAQTTLYNEVSRQVFTQYALNTLPQREIDSIREDASDDVTEFKEDCKTNAKDNDKDYDTYLEESLTAKGVSTLEELEELYFYQGLKSEILDDYVKENDHYNYFLEKYLATYTPYQVKHILVAANTADTKYKDGVMTTDNARKLLNVLNRFVAGDTFESIALLTDDVSSAENGGVMPFNEAQNYVSEFRFATYVQDIFQNNTDLTERYNAAAKLHIITDDVDDADYVTPEEFEQSNLYKTYKDGIGSVKLQDIMALDGEVDDTMAGAYNYFKDGALKDGVEPVKIAEQPYEMNVQKYNCEGDLNEKYYKESQLERNVIFNKTLNSHKLRYIELDDTTANSMESNKVVINGKNYLADQNGNPIFVALASTGIHFMCMVWNSNNPYDSARLSSDELVNVTTPYISDEALQSLSKIICDAHDYSTSEGADYYAVASENAGEDFNKYLNEAYFTLFDDTTTDYTEYQYTYIGRNDAYKNKSSLSSNSNSLLSSISSYASYLEYYLFDAIVYQQDSKLEEYNFNVKFTLDDEDGTIYDLVKDFVQDKLTSTNDSFTSSVRSAAETYADKLQREYEVKVAAGIWDTDGNPID